MSKKILYLISRFTIGGAEQLVLQYTDYLQKQDYKITVASVVGGGELEKEFRALGIDIIFAKEKGCLNLWYNWQAIKKWVKKNKPEIIHSHIFSADVVGFLLHKKVKWISTQHNVEQEYSWFRRLILKYILKRADKIVAVGEKVEDFCLTKLKLEKNKVILIRNGIKIEKWLAVPNDKLFSFEKLHLAIIGRIEKQKGHKYLFQALSKVNFDWHLDIFGAGSLEKDLKQLAEQLKINKKITWQGVKFNLPKQLVQIDLVVQPSLWEGLSLAIMEVMIAGRLVVASLMAGGELIINKKTGLLIQVVDEQKIAESLDWIYKHKLEAKNIAQAGRQKAEEFSLNKHLEKLCDLYDEK